MYVLLLKLPIEYSHPCDDDGENGSAPHIEIRHRCTMWKNGIHWLMESGVEGFVEVVKKRSGVLVVMRSELTMECAKVLNLVVKKNL